MRISALEEYGLRCALQLARVFGNGHIAASRIAEGEGISVEYVGKLMFLFRRAGLVEAVRGIQGGFRLKVRPEEVSLRKVFDALRDRKEGSSNFCHQFVGQQDQCVHYKECSVRPVWMLLSDYFDEVLDKLSLGDLLIRETAVQDRVHAIAKDQANGLQTLFAKRSDSRCCLEELKETELKETGSVV